MTSSKLLPYVWYPLFMGAAAASYGALLSAGASPLIASYVPVIALALAVILLENRFPERISWRPTSRDVTTDVAFIIVVQIALQRGLVALGVLVISAWMHVHAASAWWPQSWPLAAQIILMVLAVDFIRYWLHRACHSLAPLWRLHEVHHSPNILYTLNVGRFHPLEKVLHFSCDTVPFLLLGVAPQVLAGYSLLYAANGFFQHSNLRLRYGWLNYLVGSAETHRWHHDRDPATAACNFGNTTVIWDILFGTWSLPARGTGPDIGVEHQTAYPKNFWPQLWAPFLAGREAPIRRSLRGHITQAVISLYLRAARLVCAVWIARTARNPMRAQRRVLNSILRANRSTCFGQAHGFDQIKSYEQFASKVPVCDYEALRPFAELEIERGAPGLTREAPRQYVRTSGTTGRPKDIPLTPSHLMALRRANRMALAMQYAQCPDGFAGDILAFSSPAQEGLLRNGKPFGSASGIVAGNTPKALLKKFVVPGQVLSIADSRLKYLVILRLALARRDITYAGAANPSTLLMLIKLYREHQEDLVRDIRRGSFFLSGRLSRNVLAAIQDRLLAAPARALELAALNRSEGGARICDLWPRLAMVATWTCGSAGIAIDELRGQLAARTLVWELGYQSSEFRGTITLGKGSGSGFPTLDTHFFEFVEREKWDGGEREFLTLDRLRAGCAYYVLVTTPSGLYRYFINDLVTVQGFLRATPLLQFLQKGKGVTSITGEKLYESQVLSAVCAVTSKLKRTARFVMMIADEDARAYRLYAELDEGRPLSAQRFAESVDKLLGELNVEYAAKRESERLGALSVAWLEPETGEAYRHFCVQQGQREGQFKMVAIAYRREFAFELAARVTVGES
jgi:sterol desaturase/sphingolipid hydroxylase (fatty acid hydroxylase superfamily)